MMCFDYKKVFDSVPHDWIIKALELVHVPRKIISTIRNLMKVWAEKLHLHTSSNIIQYLIVMQGDFLSLSLFILSVNTLSFLLKILSSHNFGPPRKRIIIKFRTCYLLMIQRPMPKRQKKRNYN